MRIGTPIFTWDECPKCVLFDDEHGCRKIGEIEIIIDDDNTRLVCLTGKLNERDDYADVDDVDMEESWE